MAPYPREWAAYFGLSQEPSAITGWLGQAATALPGPVENTSQAISGRSFRAIGLRDHSQPEGSVADELY